MRTWTEVGMVAVMAVLLSLTGLWWSHKQREEQHADCRTTLKNVGTALEMYSTDASGRYPPRLEALVPNYLKAMPTCPASGKATYGYASAV